MKVFNIARILVEIVLVFLVCWLGFQVGEKRRIEKGEAEIDRVYITFEGYVREGDFTKAYELMTPEYRKKYGLESSAFFFSNIQRGEFYRLYPQRKIFIEDDKATLYPQGKWDTVAIKLQKIQGKWYLTGEILVFKD